MPAHGRDGAYVAVYEIPVISCSKCGEEVVMTGQPRGGLDELLYKHLREKHGGPWEGDTSR